MSDGARSLRIQLVIGFMCLALIVYFLMLGRTALVFIGSGEPAAIGLGVALMGSACLLTRCGSAVWWPRRRCCSARRGRR